MKSILLSLVATVALAASPMLGEKAPMSTAPMLGVDGTNHTLGSLAEANGLLVVFSCNTCPFVVGNGSKTEGWEGRYNGLAELAESLKIGMVLVNSNEAKREGDDSFTAMKNHARDAAYAMPYVVDEGSKLANACGARTTPHVYLFNSALELAYRGSIDDNVNRAEEVTERYLEEAMARMAEGKKIKKAETKAVGCSIKRVSK
ncbi:MAG: thioredoxin family protein [Flavobacteriales bacterium]